jgi:hypothetical protein
MNPRISFWVFLAVLPFYVLLTRGHFQSTDEIAVFQQARSLWERGDLNVGPMINTRVGRGGNHYAVYGAGQSIAAVPLYAAGKWLHNSLAGNREWRETFAGPVVGTNPAIRWGGEVEIFTVGLFGAFATALLCAVFFSFSLQLGASLRSALIGVALFGVTSQIVGFSSTFFQHVLETLTIFSCFYYLFRDAREPNWWLRLLAGAIAGFALVVRIHTLILLPALSVFLLWNVWRRHAAGVEWSRSRVLRMLLECVPFFAMIGAGIAGQFALNYLKFAELTFTGGYAGGTFDASLFTTWFGFFFSPGESIFLFTPLLLLIPLYWPPFFRRYRAESFCMLGVAASYLLFYGKYDFWHGQWCFGPRYLLVTVPFLILPLASWWDTATNRWRGVALALGAAGAFVQLLSVAVNFSYVFHHEKYAAFKPEYGYLFVPQSSQLATHYRALMAADFRVDMWLVNVYRQFGVGQLLTVALPLVGLMLFALWGLRRAIAEPRPSRKSTKAPVMVSKRPSRSSANASR